MQPYVDLIDDVITSTMAPTVSVCLVAMAGNIIPAIATTNAIIAAVQVMECLKIISGNIERCKAVSETTP